MKSINRIILELGLEKKFFEFWEKVKPVAYRLLLLRLGFYSGVVFGILFASFLTGLVVPFYLTDSFVFISSLSFLLGCGCCFIFFVSCFSHLVRKFYDWPCGCSRSEVVE